MVASNAPAEAGGLKRSSDLRSSDRDAGFYLSTSPGGAAKAVGRSSRRRAPLAAETATQVTGLEPRRLRPESSRLTIGRNRSAVCL